LLWNVENGVVRAAVDEKDRPLYMMPGDIHRGKLNRADPRDVLATFGYHNDKTCVRNLISLLRPQRLVLQDVHDGRFDDHHNGDSIYQKIRGLARGDLAIEDEVKGDAAFLKMLEDNHPFLN